MHHLDERVQALFAPGRGNTTEDRIQRVLEFMTLEREINAIMLDAKKAHADVRDADSVPGKLAAEFNALAANPDTTDAQKIDFIGRVAQVTKEAQSNALGWPSGDMISEIHRSMLKSVEVTLWLIKPPYCAETLDFASKKRTSSVHSIEMSIMIFEGAARVRKFPALPTPMNTFSAKQVSDDGELLHWPQEQPYLKQFLSAGICEWHCLRDVAEKGNNANSTPTLVCSLDGHKDCLFVKVVDYKGYNAFDFRYGHGN